MSSKVKAQAKRKHGAVKRNPRVIVVQAEGTYWSNVYDGYGGYAGKSSDTPPDDYECSQAEYDHPLYGFDATQ